MSTALQLHVLIFQKGENWIAQVLEKDLTAHGPTAYAALAAIQLVVQTHVNFDTRHRREPLSSLGEAPPEYWKAYEHAEPMLVDEESPFSPADIRPALTREPIHPF